MFKFALVAEVDNFNATIVTLRTNAQRRVNYYMYRIAARMRELVPVRTGFLRSTIVVSSKNNQVTIEVLAPYAYFVEMGTRFMAAQPFTRQSVAELAPMMFRDLRALVPGS